MHWKTILDNQYAIAVFTAIFGFVLAVVLERLKARDKVRKELSWDLDIRREKPATGDRKKRPISIAYNGTQVVDLVQVHLTVENTGNTVVKQEELRIRLPEHAKLLAIGFDPVPERELAAGEKRDPALSAAERLYVIGHLEVGQKVELEIVTDGGSWAGWKDLHPHNEQGDVRFLPRDIARAREDEEEVAPFFVSLAGLILLLLVGVAFPAPVALAALAVAVPLGGYFLSKLPKVTRVLRRLLAVMLPGVKYQISVGNGQGLQIGDTNEQNNRYGSRPE